MPQKININTAKTKELQALLPVGQRRVAERIIAYRKIYGSFKKMDDLLKVNGVNQEILDQIKPNLLIINNKTSQRRTLKKVTKKAPRRPQPTTPPTDLLKKRIKKATTKPSSKSNKWSFKNILRKVRNKVRSSTRPSRPKANPANYKKRLKNAEIINTAKRLHIEPAAIKAVIEVESSGSGFLNSGRPKILFEGHIFWRELEARLITPGRHVFRNEDILYPKWTREHYRGGEGEHERLEKAMKIHEEAALSSASWGLFQVMGFNYYVTEYDNVKDFAAAQYISEYEHFKAFMGFVKANNLTQHLRNKDWASFARGYNGASYAKNKYDIKMANQYRLAKKEGW